MRLSKLSISTSIFLRVLLAITTVVSVAIPRVGLAQLNQSDVTGPNLSDITGPNLSDVTGPNQSDNTGLNGEQIFRNANGDFVSLFELFEDFFDTYGEELGIDEDASLAEKLRQANQACSSQNGGTRRFARTPGANIRPVSLACEEFGNLIQSAKQSLDTFKQSQTQSNPADRRLW
ncbi:MAG: hypothetical protein AAGI69_11730 [Cyanobacteria bacterium P01_H01_bin.21]